MRSRFEKDLEGYSAVAKEQLESGDKSPEELGELVSVLDWHLKKAAERQHTTPEIQEEIYDLQIKKQEIMSALKEQLTCLNSPECIIESESGARPARYNHEDSNFLYFDDNGDDRNATFGEIISDIDWGIYYDLDKTAPRAIQKRYLVQCAKKKLRDILDLQIIKSEVAGDISHVYKKEAYLAAEAGMESGERERQSGFVSERIVKDILKRASFDLKDMPFEIHEADIFQDVEQKIDFIIHLKNVSRGVEVQSSDEAKDVGVQFSINPQAEMHKQYQVEQSMRRLREMKERIQDIALVVFPLRRVGMIREAWEKSGRPAGGPGRFLDKSTAHKLFSELLKGLVSAAVIEKSWQEMEGYFEESRPATI